MEISIKKENVIRAYNHSTDGQKRLLKDLFGEKIFTPIERIKTFCDACYELGNEHPYVIAYQKYVGGCYEKEKDIIAYLKLRIICVALNEGWEPTYAKGEYRYCPWFSLYSGLACADAAYDASDAGSTFGSRLVFKTKELAIYAGKQFIDIYADFIL